MFLLPIWHILHPLKYVCVPNATICPLLRSLHVCTHSIITSNSKIWQKDSFLDHKNYIVVFSIFCPLSTSYICVSIHAQVVFVINMTLCIHWSKGFFGGLHCDETLNVIVLICIMTWISHMKWNLFSSLYNNLNITMRHKQKLWHVKLFHSKNSHVTWDFFIWMVFYLSKFQF